MGAVAAASHPEAAGISGVEVRGVVLAGGQPERVGAIRGAAAELAGTATVGDVVLPQDDDGSLDLEALDRGDDPVGQDGEQRVLTIPRTARAPRPVRGRSSSIPPSSDSTRVRTIDSPRFTEVSRSKPSGRPTPSSSTVTRSRPAIRSGWTTIDPSVPDSSG